MIKQLSKLYFVIVISIIIPACNMSVQDAKIDEEKGTTERSAWVVRGYDIVAAATGVAKSPNPPAMDVDVDPQNSKYYVYMARRYQNYSNGKSEIEVVKSGEHGEGPFSRETFGVGYTCNPAFCISRVDRVPQVIVTRGCYGARMVHYWRNPNTNTWVEQEVLNTQCVGSPAMISNMKAPYNIEVVYQGLDGNIRHIWREGQGCWHEDQTLLPLPAGYQICNDPAITQTTANQFIHVTTVVRDNSGNYYLAYWIRGADSPTWSAPVIWRGAGGGLQPYISNLVRPVIVANNTEHVIIICKSTVNYANEFYGYSTRGTTINRPVIQNYNPLRLSKADFHKDAYKYSIGGIGVPGYSDLREIYLGFTELFDQNSTLTWFIHTSVGA